MSFVWLMVGFFIEACFIMLNRSCYFWGLWFGLVAGFSNQLPLAKLCCLLALVAVHRTLVSELAIAMCFFRKYIDNVAIMGKQIGVSFNVFRSSNHERILPLSWFRYQL